MTQMTRFLMVFWRLVYDLDLQNLRCDLRLPLLAELRNARPMLQLCTHARGGPHQVLGALPRTLRAQPGASTGHSRAMPSRAIQSRGDTRMTPTDYAPGAPYPQLVIRRGKLRTIPPGTSIREVKEPLHCLGVADISANMPRKPIQK